MLAIVYQNTGLIYTQKTTKELLISLPGSDIYSLLVLQYIWTILKWGAQI